MDVVLWKVFCKGSLRDQVLAKTTKIDGKYRGPY